MQHLSPRRYRGPDVWARVKAAYLAAEPVPSVCRRFDVGLANLRRRAAEADAITRAARNLADLVNRNGLEPGTAVIRVRQRRA